MPSRSSYAAPGLVFQASPADLGFNLDLDGMLSAANQEQTDIYLAGLLGLSSRRFLCPGGHPAQLQPGRSQVARLFIRAGSAALQCSGNSRLRLTRVCWISSPVKAAQPWMSKPSVGLIQKAGLSLDHRSIDLPTTSTPPLPASIQNLEIFLKQTIRLSNYDGIAGVFLSDLQSNQEFTFVLNHGSEVDKPEAVSFTGASTIKIPIMISVMRRVPETPDAATVSRLEQMIAFSNNAASDWLMKNLLDPVRGPLKVTEDMQSLGLQNTFLAGFFALGSPLLQRYITPGNSRTDLSTQPDLYNQANPAEIGRLLKGIYQCAEKGQGELVTAFPGEITQSKCQVMVKYLKMDRMPYMIQYGLPDGTVTAHKHGWVSDAQNIIHDMSDAAIVYTPYGDYVLTIYLNKPDLLVFDDGNKLVGDLSKVVYNYFKVNAEK